MHASVPFPWWSSGPGAPGLVMALHSLCTHEMDVLRPCTLRRWQGSQPRYHHRQRSHRTPYCWYPDSKVYTAMSLTQLWIEHPFPWMLWAPMPMPHGYSEHPSSWRLWASVHMGALSIHPTNHGWVCKISGSVRQDPEAKCSKTSFTCVR